MKRFVLAVAAATLLTSALVALAAAPASAHETATAGDLALELGWGTEPAYAGQLNTVQLIVTHKADGDPINDPGARLTALVSYGDQQQEFAMTPTYDAAAGTGVPGEYAALIIPTAPGDYAFHITGKVEGVKVDLEVASSPKTFSPVEDAQAAQFPVKVPGTDQVAQRLDKELARVAVTHEDHGDLSSQVSAARTIGFVGIAVGAVGVLLAAVALAARRRA
jgi:hypothetical protein